MNFGEIVKKEMAEKGYELKDLQRLTVSEDKPKGLHPSNISDLINNRGENPQLKTMQILAKALNLVFQILPDPKEPLKYYNGVKNVQIHNSEYDEKILNFLRDPRNEKWIRYSMLCAEYGPDSTAADSYKEVILRYEKPTV